MVKVALLLSVLCVYRPDVCTAVRYSLQINSGVPVPSPSVAVPSDVVCALLCNKEPTCKMFLWNVTSALVRYIAGTADNKSNKIY